jgi:hypothetical protein
MAVTAPIFTYLMAAGTVQLAQDDPLIPKQQKSLWRPAFWKAWHRSDLNGYMPGPVWFLPPVYGSLNPIITRFMKLRQSLHKTI